MICYEWKAIGIKLVLLEVVIFYHTADLRIGPTLELQIVINPPGICPPTKHVTEPI